MSLIAKSMLRNIPQLVNVAKVGGIRGCLFHTARSLNAAQVQKPAPAFSGTAVVNHDFKDIKLDDFKGKYLVLFFYPLDFTFVCPTEIIAFSDRIQEFRDLNTEVVGVSVDSHFSLLESSPSTMGTQTIGASIRRFWRSTSKPMECRTGARCRC